MIRKFIFGKPFETDATVLQIEKENQFAEKSAMENLKEQGYEVVCSEDGFSFECKMTTAEKLMVEEKAVKKEAKEIAEALHIKTKETGEKYGSD